MIDKLFSDIITTLFEPISSFARDNYRIFIIVFIMLSLWFVRDAMRDGHEKGIFQCKEFKGQGIKGSTFDRVVGFVFFTILCLIAFLGH